MLSIAIITSLKILFVYGAMQEGMILFQLRRIIDWMIQPLPPTIFLWLRKPLYDCLFCMASIWGIIFTIDSSSFQLRHLELYFTGHLVGFNVWFFSNEYIGLLFAIGGINYIIQSVFIKEENRDEDVPKNHSGEIEAGDIVELLRFYVGANGDYYWMQQFKTIPKTGDRFKVKCVYQDGVCVEMGGRDDMFFSLDQIKKL